MVKGSIPRAQIDVLPLWTSSGWNGKMEKRRGTRFAIHTNAFLPEGRGAGVGQSRCALEQGSQRDRDRSPPCSVMTCASPVSFLVSQNEVDLATAAGKTLRCTNRSAAGCIRSTPATVLAVSPSSKEAQVPTLVIARLVCEDLQERLCFCTKNFQWCVEETQHFPLQTVTVAASVFWGWFLVSVVCFRFKH